MPADRVRVLQVLQHAALGGGTLVAMTLAERLDRDRYDVTIATGRDAGTEGSLLDEMRARGLRVVTLQHMSRAPGPKRDARAAWELGRLLASQRPEIVHTHGSKPKLLLPVAAQIGPAPIRIAHLHGWEWQPARHALEAAAFTAEARLVAEAYHAMIATSHATRQDGLDRGVGHPAQYEVVHPSIDPVQFAPRGHAALRRQVRDELGLARDAFVVASVLRLVPQKAPEVLIRAAVMAAARPDIRWLVVGGGPLEPQVRELIDGLGLSERVRLLGPRRDVPRLLQACDAFALSSAWEPFGLVYLEAAAAGLPVVGTRVDGTPEAVADGETGILVPPGRPDLLAAAIMRIASDHGLARAMGAAGVAHVQRFEHDRFVREVAAIYDRLLAERRRGAQR